MDGIVRVPVYIALSDVIESAQPRVHHSCDWLSDPLAMGLLIFPLHIYEKMEALQNGHLSR